MKLRFLPNYLEKRRTPEDHQVHDDEHRKRCRYSSGGFMYDFILTSFDSKLQNPANIPSQPTPAQVYSTTEETDNELHQSESDVTSDLPVSQALWTDLGWSGQLAMKAIAIAWVKLHQVPEFLVPLQIVTLLLGDMQSFAGFAGNNDEPIIVVRPSFELGASDSHAPDASFDRINIFSDVKILNELCQRLFSGASSILYCAMTLRCEYSTTTNKPVFAQKNSGYMQKRLQSTMYPRFHLKVPVPVHNLTNLLAVKYGDRLAAFASISFFSPLRRIRAGCGSYFARPLHCCPGYSREEITLASDISRSAIITHEYPSESEVCIGCGQLGHIGFIKT
ncbi:LOW QUALITY PROTEIN: hypothetical protein CVT26_010499 [Gymnopilus dilepis]|uniref:Uncharacterized protein n=1 Tax=Gymnopilus dilepis TaxID=231916 RepID=A0A409W524_9AGAR|nr:LOW QUALITY PROTEIN: hypothetical protein CVT26_010499 [Gymnopilus dilepis]